MKTFGPKLKEHPSISKPCPACNKPFIEGDYTTLINLGPGNDPDEQRKAREGRPYNDVAIEVHFSCATGREWG